MILQLPQTAEALFEGHRPLAGHLARHYARRWRVQPADWSEVEQVALIGLWEAAGCWRSAGGTSFRTFAWMHIGWAVLQHLRTAKPGRWAAQRRGEEAPVLVQLEEAALPLMRGDNGVPRDLAVDVERMLSILPERQRVVLEELVLHGLPLDVVAARLRIRKASVWVLQHKALRTLRRRYGRPA